MMAAMRNIHKGYKLNQEQDTSPLFFHTMEILNDAGDKSAPLTSTIIERPGYRLGKAEEAAIRRGEPIQPPREALTAHRKTHRAIGHDSPVTGVITLECVVESVCSRLCDSPYARSLHFLNGLILEFPTSDDPGYTAEQPYSINGLIALFMQREERSDQRATCEYLKCKAKADRVVKKVVGTPEVLVVQVQRLTLEGQVAAATNQDVEEDIDQRAGFIRNPVTVDETIDLSEYCELELPTEKLHGESLPKPANGTKYKLKALIRWRDSHFFTYALTPDDSGSLHWCRMDDTLHNVGWETPITSVPQIGHSYDFMFFYERVDPVTCEFLTVDNRFGKVAETIEISSDNDSSSFDEEYAEEAKKQDQEKKQQKEEEEEGETRRRRTKRKSNMPARRTEVASPTRTYRCTTTTRRVSTLPAHHIPLLELTNTL